MALCWCMSPVMVALETQRLERKVSGKWNSARSQSAEKKYEGRESCFSCLHLFAPSPQCQRLEQAGLV